MAVGTVLIVNGLSCGRFGFRPDLIAGDWWAMDMRHHQMVHTSGFLIPSISGTIILLAGLAGWPISEPLAKVICRGLGGVDDPLALAMFAVRMLTYGLIALGVVLLLLALAY